MNTKSRSRGQFLVIEGPDGVGKTTQMELLRTYLQERGAEVIVLREPGGTVIGEGIRDLFKANFGQTDPVTEVLLLLAARRQLTMEVIQPALRRGAWVVCDRHTPSTFAYQGAGQRLGFSPIIRLRQAMGSLNHNADATVILQLDEEERQRRLSVRGVSDKIDQADPTFHKRVVGAYREMVERSWTLNIGDLTGVEACGTPDEVHDRILQAFFHKLSSLDNEQY